MRRRMHGQGGAWSLACGLWAPGDPQFKRSLPVACGALPQATEEIPSYSWEHKMELETNIKKGLSPEVDQDLKATTLNNSTSSMIPPQPVAITSNIPLLDYPSSDSDDVIQKELTPISGLQPSKLNHPSNKHSNDPDFTATVEWEDMTYSEQMTFMCFLQAGVTKEEAIARINEARQEEETVCCNEPDPSGQQEPCDKTLIIEPNTPENGKSADLDDSSDSDAEDHGESPDKEEAESHKEIISQDKTTEKGQRLRHPDCKLTLEEVKKMSTQILTKKARQRFVYTVYCLGADHEEEMKICKAKDENKPRIELRKMSKILPKRFRSEFYCRSMKGTKPQTLMRKYLSRPELQEWLLCKRLKLSDSTLLSKMFQQAGDPEPKPLKEWFTLFLQEGCVDEAVNKVKNLILRGDVANVVNSLEEEAGNQLEKSSSADHPDDALEAPLHPAELAREPTSCRKLGPKAMRRRSKKFQVLDDGKKKVYDNWRAQGLSHQDALTIVLRFPGDKKPCNNLCAWGRCDQHPGPPKLLRKKQKRAAGQPGGSVLSVTQKKTIFDRVPAPSTLVDSAQAAAMEQRGFHNAIGGSPNPVFLTGQAELTSSVPPPSQAILPPFLPGQPIQSTAPPSTAASAPQTSVVKVPREHKPVCSIGIPSSNPLFLPGPPILATSAATSCQSILPPFPPGQTQSAPPPLMNSQPTSVLSHSTAPTVLATGSGIRVPQKSTFIDVPIIDLTGPEPEPEPPSNALHLCIVALNHPNDGLSEEQIDSIASSIDLAISNISNVRMRPIFLKTVRINGKYGIICKDQLSKKWVRKYVDCMRSVLPLKVISSSPNELCDKEPTSIGKSRRSSAPAGGENGVKTGMDAGANNNTVVVRRNSDSERSVATSKKHLAGGGTSILAVEKAEKESSPENLRAQITQDRRPRGRYEGYGVPPGQPFHHSYPGPRGIPFRGPMGYHMHQGNYPYPYPPPRIPPHFQRMPHFWFRGDHYFPRRPPFDMPRFPRFPFMGNLVPVGFEDHSRVPPNGRPDSFFLQKPLAVELDATRSRVRVPEKSPSPDFDNVLKSAKARLNIDDSKPTEKHSTVGERPKPALPDESSGTKQHSLAERSDSPQRASAPGPHIARNGSHSPMRSLYPPGAKHRLPSKRSDSPKRTSTTGVNFARDRSRSPLCYSSCPPDTDGAKQQRRSTKPSYSPQRISTLDRRRGRGRSRSPSHSSYPPEPTTGAKPPTKWGYSLQEISKSGRRRARDHSRSPKRSSSRSYKDRFIRPAKKSKSSNRY